MYWLEIQVEDMISLEKLILKKEDRIDEEVTDVESINDKDKRKNNNMEILSACPWKLKWVQVE